MHDRREVPRSVRFSARTDWDTTETVWSQTRAQRRSLNLPVYDLTAANATQCGFTFAPELLSAFHSPDALIYQPDPKGLLAAREAVCTYYSDHAVVSSSSLAPSELVLPPERIVLTSSTSEAYSFLFRLLCDPGDEVLIAQPSYPLFDFLAVLENVKLLTYPLFYDHGWHLDPASLRQRISPRTRAIVLVHPNNPTGHFTSYEDRQWLEALCQEHGLALIVDEVFLDYSFAGKPRSFLIGPHPALTFVLSGLSKVAALPQMKLAWIAACGPPVPLQAALDRLDVIADTFLSVNTPAQCALPAWLHQRHFIQSQIQQRVIRNLAVLDSQLTETGSLDRLLVEGGWYAIVRAPAHASGESTALHLLQQTGVAVHPGSFFGMPGDQCYVVSLLPQAASFEAGCARLLTFLDR